MIIKDDDGNTVIEITRVDCCHFRLQFSNVKDNSSVILIMNAEIMTDALSQLGFLSEGNHEVDGAGQARH